MSVSLSEICENTKMGREYALLGNYETSQTYYQAVLQQIQKLLTTINDQARRSKWNQVRLRVIYSGTGTTGMLIFSSISTCLRMCLRLQVRQALAQEYEQVKDIHGILQSFKTDEPSQRQAYIGRDFSAPTRYEEPTRDPDVWPPPTPVEHK